MIKFISDNPEKRPVIFQIYSVVKVMYGILIKVSIDLMDIKSNESFY